MTCTSALSGYLVRTDSTGPFQTKKRFWFAFADETCRLYWYKSHQENSPIGHVDIATAVFLFEPECPRIFEIKGKSHSLHLEADSDRLRYQWLEELQIRRKQFHDRKASEFGVANGATDTSPTRSTDEGLLVDFDMPTPAMQEVRDGCPFESETVVNGQPLQANSVFYLNEDETTGDGLAARAAENDHSLGAATLGKPLRSLSKQDSTSSRRPVLRLPSMRLSKGKACENCNELVSVINTLKDRCGDLSDELQANKDLLQVMKNAVVVYKNQIESLKEIVSRGAMLSETDLLLAKEKKIAELHIHNTSYKSEIENMRERLSQLEADLCDRTQELSNMTDLLRSKEEVLWRMVGTDAKAGNKQRVSQISGQLDDLLGFGLEVAVAADGSGTPHEYSATDLAGSFKETDELRDTAKAYQAQNQFLNKEILELHTIIQASEHRERTLTRQNMHVEALYYQLKSKYLLLLNHVKPETGHKVDQDTINQLVDDAAKTLSAENSLKLESSVDPLGFFKGGQQDDESCNNACEIGLPKDILSKASEYKKRSDAVMEAHERATSKDYIEWLTKWDSQLVNAPDKVLKPSPELKSLVRDGVPHNYRSRVWKSMVRWRTKDTEAELGNGYYESLQRRSVEHRDIYDPALKQIDLDLGRTLPQNKHFASMQAEKISELKRVLYAFRFHNSEIGYCQGLNRVAAVALLYLSEQDAFWALVAIVAHLQPFDYYSSTMIGSQADQRVLKDLVQEKLPRIAQTLRHFDVDLSLFTLNWFLTIFVDNVPHTTYLCIWDAFLFEGNKVLFRFALAALKLFEAEILACTTAGAVYMCLSTIGSRLQNYAKLAQIAFTDLNPFPMKNVEHRRTQHLEAVKKEITAFQSPRDYK